GMREIAVPDRARDLPTAVGLPLPDPNALAFVMDRPAAALRHAVEDPAVPVEGDIAKNLQLFGKDKKQRFRRRETLAPQGTLGLDTADGRTIGPHADGVVGGESLHRRDVFAVEGGDEFFPPPLD